jgi:hypothetical protein
MSVGELLLKLTSQSAVDSKKDPDQRVAASKSPLLDFTESLELGNGNKDDNSLSTAFYINFAGCRDLQRPKFGLQLGNIALQV